MPQQFFWRAVLVAILCVTLAVPARASSFETLGKEIAIGIAVVAAAVAVLVTVVILHHKNKKSVITGCVTSGTNGMSLTDEKDKRMYALSGDPVGVKPGDKMTLEGKRRERGKTFVFEAERVTRDFGACQP